MSQCFTQMWAQRLTSKSATKSVLFLARRCIYFLTRRPEKVKGSDETGRIYRLREIFSRDVSRISMAVEIKTGYLVGKQSRSEICFVPKHDTFKVYVEGEASSLRWCTALCVSEVKDLALKIPGSSLKTRTLLNFVGFLKTSAKETSFSLQDIFSWFPIYLSYLIIFFY